jgi:hypothetical protein
MINSEYSHIYDEGYDPNMYTYHSSEVIQSIGKTHKYTINEPLDSLSTTVNIIKNV